MKLALAGFLVYVIFLVRDILVLVLFGIIISVLFDPVIDYLQKKKDTARRLHLRRIPYSLWHSFVYDFCHHPYLCSRDPRVFPATSSVL